MIEWVYRKTRWHYVLVMMFGMRLLGCIGGCLVLYYIRLTTTMPPDIRRPFNRVGLLLVLVAVTATMFLSLWNSRHLRRVLKLLATGQPVDRQLGRRAGLEAVHFPHCENLGEAALLPVCFVLPMTLYLLHRFGVQGSVLMQVTFATFLGVAAILLVTFFASERWIQVVVRDLIRHGIEIDFPALPPTRLQRRMVVCFTLILLVSTVMIGALADRRAQDLISFPDGHVSAVARLRRDTLSITVIAVVVGVVYSRMLANSIASRVNHLVSVMQRVAAGDLSQRLYPCGTDEIDALTRQFNQMVEELQRQNASVRELQSTLEHKVRRRTRELMLNRRSLQESLHKLREADRHKSEFFSNVSHELRTPLLMILSPIEQLLRKERDALSPQGGALVDVARVNAHRLLRLINQLLEFSKIEAGRARLDTSAVDIGRLIDRLVMAAGPLAEQRQLQLEVQVDPTLPAIQADAEKLDMVITNLLSNALKFTPHGGTIVIEALRWSASASALSEDHLCVSVRDNGIGIAPEHMSRLFARFVQVDGSTSREFAGTGLGLALVKEFVELHGGAVHVESQPGVGSHFWFTIPLTVPDTHATMISPSASSQLLRAHRFADLVPCSPLAELDPPLSMPRGQRQGTVLVVDDTPEVRELIGALLSDEYDIVFAGDGAEGLEVVAAAVPDVIISDVMMPRVDGHEFCRRIKRDPLTAAVPFILLTAQTQSSQKVQGLDSGADDYLVKPFNLEELRARVRSLMRLRRMHQDLDRRNRELQAALCELHAAQRQLVQSEKMSSLGQLVAGLAHEINNSINAVNNGVPSLIERTERLQRLVASALGELPVDAPVRDEIGKSFSRIERLAGVIREGADRTARIVCDMKTFAHPGSDRAEEFDLNRALDMCINLLGKQCGDRITIHRDYATIETLHGPYGQLNQVFLNLLSNAVQAVSGEGEIYVSTWRTGDQFGVTVRDTGCGIPATIRNRIFDPFFTTKPPGVGTGLGLSISYGIVARLGGTIDCISEEGAGAEFAVRLPIAPQQTPTPRVESRWPALTPA